MLGDGKSLLQRRIQKHSVFVFVITDMFPVQAATVSKVSFLKLSNISFHPNQTIRPLTEMIEVLIVGALQGSDKYRNLL